MSRVGIRSLVLEQSDSLRTEGASISLFKNGWRVLDMLGVGSELRTHFLDIQGSVLPFSSFFLFFLCCKWAKGFRVRFEFIYIK